MKTSVFLPISILLLVHMAAAASPFEDIRMLAEEINVSHYDDPDGLLVSMFCECCKGLAEYCPNLSEPKWPNQHSQVLRDADFLLQSTVESNHDLNTPRPQHQNHSQPPHLQLETDYDYGMNEPYGSFDGWSSGSYNPGYGDRSQRSDDGISPNTRRRVTPRAEGFQCSHCSKVFSRECDLTRHGMNHQDKSERRHECPEPDCQERFHYPKDVIRHLKTHQPGERFFCPHSDCKSSVDGFTREDNRRRHVLSKHSGGSSFGTPASVYSGTSGS